MGPENRIPQVTLGHTFHEDLTSFRVEPMRVESRCLQQNLGFRSWMGWKIGKYCEHMVVLLEENRETTVEKLGNLAGVENP